MVESSNNARMIGWAMAFVAALGTGLAALLLSPLVVTCITLIAAAVSAAALMIPPARRRQALVAYARWHVIRGVLAHPLLLLGAGFLVSLLVLPLFLTGQSTAGESWGWGTALAIGWFIARRQERAGSAESWRGSLLFAAILSAAGLVGPPAVLRAIYGTRFVSESATMPLLVYGALIAATGAMLGVALSYSVVREVRREQAAAAVVPQAMADVSPSLRERPFAVAANASSPVVPQLRKPEVRSDNPAPLAFADFAEQFFGQDRVLTAWQALLAQHLPYYQGGVVQRPLSVLHVGASGSGKRYLAELLAAGPLRGLDVQIIDGLETPDSAQRLVRLHEVLAEGHPQFRRSVIIACLDDPGGVIAGLCADGEPEPRQLIEALAGRFDRQILGSFTRVVPFIPLDATACALIAGRHLERLADRAGLVVTRLDARLLARCADLATASVVAVGARAIQLAVPRVVGDGFERCRLLRAATVELGLDDAGAVQLRITSTLA